MLATPTNLVSLNKFLSFVEKTDFMIKKTRKFFNKHFKAIRDVLVQCIIITNTAQNIKFIKFNRMISYLVCKFYFQINNTLYLLN